VICVQHITSDDDDHASFVSKIHVIHPSVDMGIGLRDIFLWLLSDIGKTVGFNG